VTHRFEREFAHLRGLGFAEALPIENAPDSPGIVARLESGRVGVAVEFYEPHVEVAYALVPLDATPGSHPGRPTHRWDDVVKDVHRHMPPGDDD
jgi:hypothetical protein